MMKPNKILANLLLLAMVVGSSLRAQSTRASGSLTGFVFLITKGGDIKPARLAHGVVLFINPKQLAPEEEFPKTTVGGVWGQHEHDLLVAGISDAMNGKSELNCLRSLRKVHSDLESTQEWAASHKLEKQIIKFEIDEEGHFKIPSAPVGEYYVVVEGRAGSLNAWWSAFVLITANKTTATKITDPRDACADLT